MVNVCRVSKKGKKTNKHTYTQTYTCIYEGESERFGRCVLAPLQSNTCYGFLEAPILDAPISIIFRQKRKMLWLPDPLDSVLVGFTANYIS